MMSPTQQQPEILTPEQAAEALKPEIDRILKDRIDDDFAQEKQRQYFRLDKADKYNRGMTFLAPEFDGAGRLSWSGVSVSSASEQDAEAAGVYDQHIDITKSYGRKYSAVLGVRPFHNVKGKPRNPLSQADRKAARQAEMLVPLFKHAWNIRTRNIELFAKQWKAGDVYAYLDFTADGKKWGEYEEPRYAPKEVEVQPAGYRCPSCAAVSNEPAVSQTDDGMGGMVEMMACPHCGSGMSAANFEDAVTATVPEFTGNVKYPHGGVNLTLCTGYTVTTFFDTVDFDRTPALLYEYEAHPGDLLRHYGDDLRKHCNERGELRKPGDDAAGQVHEQGVQARTSAASLTASRGLKKNRWTYSRYWLMPSVYEYLPDGLRETANRHYPDGMKVCRVEGITVRLEPECLTDHWEVFTPEPDDYLYRDPVCWSMLPTQDLTNDFWQLIIAHLERGLPSHIADPGVIDPARLNDRNRQHEILWAKQDTSGRLDGAIKTIPAAKFPDQAPQVIDALEGTVQRHYGILPAVWGGQGGNKTAEQARADLTQALMQLSVPGEYATAGWTGVFTKAVKLYAKHSTKPVASMTGEVVDLDALRSGSFYFEGDPGIPMSWAEIQQRLDLIVSQSPDLVQNLGLALPINSAVARDYLLPGLNEIRVPNEDETNKMLDRIRLMIEEEPVNDGQMWRPSVMPDPDIDDAPLCADIVRQWLNSDQGRAAEKTNPKGYANVKLHLAELKAMAMPPVPVGPDGQPLPPDGGPPPNQNPAPGPAMPPPQ